jgi:hypothetical protein
MTRPFLILALASLLASGCRGLLDEPGPAGPRGRDDCGGAGCVDRAAPSSRVPRLSHAEWENTTRDLLLLDAPSGLSSTFIGDPIEGTFDNDGAALSVGASLARDYERAAEELARRVTQDPAALERLLPAGAPLEPGARLEAFVRHFGERAYRRPVTTDEVARLTRLAADAPTHYPELDRFAGGARLVIEAVLQMPHFLYRPELTPADGSRAFELSSWEIASRLAYALWGSMPDAELFDAARADRLRDPEVLRAQAERMVDDPRAHATVGRFHFQWLDGSRFADLRRSPMLFPEWDAALPRSMEEETLRFVEAVVFEEEGSLDLLLTADWTVADPLLGRVYGVEVPSDWVRVRLDPSQRAGILTQIGFLASQATAIESDPIHRGVHINRRVLCATLPPPPAVVAPLPDPDPSTPKTLRQRIDEHTGEGTCGARCHGTMINPIGFAYEHFDALGRWRTLDTGLPVDARGTYEFETGAASYDGAAELARLMVEQLSTHECYAGHWLQFLYGRRQMSSDATLVGRLGEASQAGLSIREMILELVTSRAFVTRTSTELEVEAGGTP